MEGAAMAEVMAALKSVDALARVDDPSPLASTPATPATSLGVKVRVRSTRTAVLPRGMERGVEEGAPGVLTPPAPPCCCNSRRSPPSMTPLHPPLPVFPALVLDTPMALPAPKSNTLVTVMRFGEGRLAICA